MRIAVTGAYGYSGKYMAQRLLAAGHELLTLTNSPNRPNPFGPKIATAPLNFSRPAELEQSLRGVQTLINTYWVRFNHKLFTHDQAVTNTRILFDAAKRAGVKRIIHVSITKPDLNSDLSYFRGKAQLEEALKASGLTYCILRPTVLFGREDILINNIAWGLRTMPVFGLFGDGQYKLQPIYVDDLADAAAAQATQTDNQIIDAIGPETYTYRGLVEMIAEKIGVKPRLVAMPPWLGLQVTGILGWFVDDVVITGDEIQGLMENRLVVDSPPLGKTKLSEWVAQYHGRLGLRYTSEMARRINRVSGYQSN
jgi:uncharacterized protein YbjT (DUF2867 family)